MKKTFFKKLFTASIAAITALSVFRGVPTFADDNSATAKANGETNAKVAINKTLNIAEGITTPKATFKFTFTPKTGTSSNSAPYQMASNSDKTKGYIPERIVSYTENDQLTSGQTSIKKDTGDIFDGISYEHAGEYVYTVEEMQNTYKPIKDKNNKDIDAINYDKRTYDMHVIVKNKDNGTYISSVYFKEVKNQVEESAKKEPSSEPDAETYKYDLFENTYTKDGGKIDPNDPHPNNPDKDKTDKTKKSLTISKIVDGSSGDRTKDFNFKLTITLPSTNKTSAAPVTNIVVRHGDRSEELAILNTEVITHNFTLKHGESLTIDDLPAGSRYTLTETGVPGYTASSLYMTNGVSTKGIAGVLSSDYTLSDILVGEKTNDNTVTNKIDDVTPTGLLIDNLPFILMIGLGLAGFVVLSKKRREA